MKTFDKSFIVIFTLFLLIISFILYLPYLITQKSWVSFDLSGFASLGDSLGGIMGPFIAIAAALLTFLAFWVQFKANEQQRQDIQVERFERKYYELIRIQRENVSEMKIKDKYSGRKVFVALYNELRFCFYTVKKHTQEYPEGTTVLDLGFDPNDDETIFKIAYLVFYLGTGDNSDKLLHESMNRFTTIFFREKLFSEIKNIQDDFSKNSLNQETNPITLSFSDNLNIKYELGYKPFDGHISRLGHYYRNLYQTVKFVAVCKNPKFSFNEKYNYLKTLRAQLSSHEQVLLYYSSLSTLGKSWLKVDYPFLIDYKLIKNMPLPLADFGIKPEIKFKKEINFCNDKNESFFEWIA